MDAALNFKLYRLPFCVCLSALFALQIEQYVGKRTRYRPVASYYQSLCFVWLVLF